MGASEVLEEGDSHVFNYSSSHQSFCPFLSALLSSGAELVTFNCPGDLQLHQGPEVSPPTISPIALQVQLPASASLRMSLTLYCQENKAKHDPPLGLNFREITISWKLVCLLVGVEPKDDQVKDQEKERFIITCSKQGEHGNLSQSNGSLNSKTGEVLS